MGKDVIKFFVRILAVHVETIQAGLFSSCAVFPKMNKMQNI